MKQKIEIKVDVPDDMEIKCQGSRNDLRPVITPTECTSQIVCNVILRRREPVRESRWRRCPEKDSSEGCCLWSKREDAIQVYSHHRLERLDYENGKLVRVTLEEVSDG